MVSMPHAMQRGLAALCALSPLALPPLALPLLALPPLVPPPLSLPPIALQPLALPPFALPSFGLQPLALPPITLPLLALSPLAFPLLALPLLVHPPLALPPLALHHQECIQTWSNTFWWTSNCGLYDLHRSLDAIFCSTHSDDDFRLSSTSAIQSPHTHGSCFIHYSRG